MIAIIIIISSSSSNDSLSIAVGIVTGYVLDNLRDRVRDPVESKMISSSYHPDRLFGPPGLLSNDYKESLTWG
jgi:hypothetical protein